MDSELLQAIVPFHFFIDRDLRIAGVGRSLQKMIPTFAVGTPLSGHVRVQHPACELTYDDLSRRVDKLFLFDFLSIEATLRGQFLKGDAGLLFIGSPWVESMAILNGLGVTMRDFAICDPTVENLFLRQGQRTQAIDHHRLLERLRVSAIRKKENERARRALVHDLDASGDMLMRFGEDGIIQSLTAARKDYFPADCRSLIGVPVQNVLPELGLAIQLRLPELQDNHQSTPIEYEIKCKGSEFSFRGRLAKTLSGDYLLLACDESQKRQLERRLEFLAHHDPLTGLPNRLFFEQRAKEVFEAEKNCAVFYIDVNEFKSVNDCYGHSVGDQLLVAIGRRLLADCQNRYLPARLGGDEFAVLAEGSIDAESARRLANELMDSLSCSLHLEEVTLSPQVSLGVVLRKQGESVHQVLRNADVAMYAAKSAAQTVGAITVFEPEMLQAFLDRVERKRDFQDALDGQQIIVHYQPIVDLSDGKCRKVEALARWNHPRRGLLSPYHFIDIAEESGAIVEMGAVVLQQACRDTKRLQEMGFALSVNVNVSAIQLLEEDYAEEVFRVLASTGLDPGSLTLELTESVLLEHPKQVIDVLEKLTQAGVAIAIDDFGVGYSSLQYLATLPVETLKVDRAFVGKVSSGNDNDIRLVQSIINLGATLGLNVVAEGIEEAAQARFLQSCSVEFGQGYLYAKPMPKDHLVEFLNAERRSVPPVFPGLTQPLESDRPQQSP
jgi:diguanylate cyclase (GGDEF)-like protein